MLTNTLRLEVLHHYRCNTLGMHPLTARYKFTNCLPIQLDGKHVVFGEVVEGMGILKQIEGQGSPSGRPSNQVKITSSGVVESE